MTNPEHEKLISHLDHWQQAEVRALLHNIDQTCPEGLVIVLDYLKKKVTS